MRNMSRILFNDGSGSLGSVADLSTDLSGAGTDASPYVLTIADMKEANFEERDLVQIGSETTAPLEIVEVDPDNSEIKLVGSSALLTGAVGTDVKIHMQGSRGADPDGLKGVIQKSNRDQIDGLDSSYGIKHGRRWESVVVDQKALNSGVAQALTTDMLNEVMLKVKKKCGKSPNLIVCSYKQYERLLNLLESTKQFTVPTRANLKSKSGADISFSGIEFMSIDGAVGIFPERFVEDDTIYFLNDNHIHIHHRPDFGWFDDDGTVFLRKAGEDEYEARYGGYLEIYINPVFHGCLKGLITA